MVHIHEWRMNNIAGIMKKINKLSHRWFNDHWWWYLSIVILITTTVIFYITHESHQWNQCEYENVKWYIRHAYGMNWKWHNWYHFHFNFNYHLKLYVFSTQNEFHWNRCSISVAPWLTTYTSFNGLWHHIIKRDINYIEIIPCESKLHEFNLVLKVCPDSTDVAKYSYALN